MSPFSNPGHDANQCAEKGTFNFSPPHKSFKQTMIFFSHNDGKHPMKRGKVECPLLRTSPVARRGAKRRHLIFPKKYFHFHQNCVDENIQIALYYV